MLKFRSLAGNNLLRGHQKPCHCRRPWAGVLFLSLGVSVSPRPQASEMDGGKQKRRENVCERERESMGYSLM